MKKGRVFKIETLGLQDGPGVRFVIFMYGCSLRCKYCHNPESWHGGNYQEYTAEEMFKKIQNYKAYFGDKGGVTISGGEPLLQSAFVERLFTMCKKENIHTVLDTAGVGDNNYDKLLKVTDLIILDVKHIKEKNYEDITGLKMKKFNEFLITLKEYKIPLWIRTVIVSDVNDNKEYILTLKEYLKDIPNIEKIELLAYSNIGETKYEELEIIYEYKNKKSMDQNKLDMLEKLL